MPKRKQPKTESGRHKIHKKPPAHGPAGSQERVPVALCFVYGGLLLGLIVQIRKLGIRFEAGKVIQDQNLVVSLALH